jgi:hypothetical protein
MDDAQRASEIITRIRALVKKAPPQKDWLDINQIIREVIGLGQSEVQRNHVALETQLSNDVPLVFADRIQLQQVMLNLMMNAIEAMTQAAGSRELLISSGGDDSRRARLRLGRTCERTNSSLTGKLNVELVPFFTAVGAAVKLPVRSAKIKRLSVQRIHHQSVPSDDIERPNFRRDFLETCPSVGAFINRALVLGSAGRGRGGGCVDDVGLVGMKDHRPKIFFHPVTSI